MTPRARRSLGGCHHAGDSSRHPEQPAPSWVLRSGSPIPLPGIPMAFPGLFSFFFFKYPHYLLFFSKRDFFPFPSPPPILLHSWGGRPGEGGADEVASSRPPVPPPSLSPSFSIHIKKKK